MLIMDNYVTGMLVIVAILPFVHCQEFAVSHASDGEQQDMGQTQKTAGAMASRNAAPQGVVPGHVRTMEDALKGIAPVVPNSNRAVIDPDLRSQTDRCSRDYNLLCPDDWSVNPLDPTSCIPLSSYTGNCSSLENSNKMTAIEKEAWSYRCLA
ncbi:MAG: hypothetical protein KVP17_002859 [Porospora cf. gigantea B]|uniref:uncharacterized protein n=1 Tax=Porospora cf. gigantea B TaxID=2853592 RepID=UPI0035718D90|nr:MAG: hypothetical protein KVP17_002859 [Porospora cf. gigantea B]